VEWSRPKTVQIILTVAEIAGGGAAVIVAVNVVAGWLRGVTVTPSELSLLASLILFVVGISMVALAARSLRNQRAAGSPPTPVVPIDLAREWDDIIVRTQELYSNGRQGGGLFSTSVRRVLQSINAPAGVNPASTASPDERGLVNGFLYVFRGTRADIGLGWSRSFLTDVVPTNLTMFWFVKETVTTTISDSAGLSQDFVQLARNASRGALTQDAKDAWHIYCDKANRLAESLNSLERRTASILKTGTVTQVPVILEL
jgi:hypothetical protein